MILRHKDDLHPINKCLYAGCSGNIRKDGGERVNSEGNLSVLVFYICFFNELLNGLSDGSD